jgi:predicted RNase H-like HicB family nuclease
MANYIAIVHKDSESDFGVSFPDFPGCITAGSNIDEAKDMAQDALALHIQGMLEDGYLFGSTVNGKLWPTINIDIAI